MSKMNFIEKYHYYFLSILFVITYFITYSIMEYNKTQRIDTHLVNLLETANVEYKLIYNIYKKNAKTIYSQIINKPNILKIIADINQTNLKRQEVKLFNQMKKGYRFSKKLGINHIHFYLKNNQSFLDIQNKNHFHYDINSTVHSIKYANKHNKKVSGFEKKDFLYSYRFVYPLHLKKEKKHIGSVEFAISANDFKTFFENTIFIDSYFLLQKEKSTDINTKNRLKKYYDESFEDAKYLQTKRDAHDNELKLFIKNNNHFYRKLLKNRLKSKKAFAVEFKVKKEYYVKVFIPIHKIHSREVIAYFVSTINSPYIKNIYADILKIHIGIFFFLLIIMYAIHKSLVYSHVLRKEIKEKTDALEASQEKIIEAKKMASLSMLIAGIAHEINTPIGLSITAISHLVEQTKHLKKDYDDEIMDEEEFINYLSKSDATLNLIFSNLVKAANLIKDFKQISMNNNSETKKVVNVKKLFENIIKTMETKLRKSSIDVELVVDSELELLTYTSVLNIIMTNLILNSILHAFKNSKNSHITIEVIQAKHNTFIHYMDNGSGMSENQVKNVYEPFYTTNRGSGGSGLGMHITFNLVTQKLGGTIDLQSKIGNGVKYTITIPN